MTQSMYLFLFMLAATAIGFMLGYVMGYNRGYDAGCTVAKARRDHDDGA